MFHKVGPSAPTPEWVTVKFFREKLQFARDHGLKVVTLANYTGRPDELVITFDDVYANVYQYAFPILKEFGYPFELFVAGKYIGQSNDFDWPEPPAQLANQAQLEEMRQFGGVLEYHTWSHPDLTQLDEQALEQEIKPMFDAKFFAYPYGRFNERIKRVVAKYYQGAVGTLTGDNSQFELLREPIWEKSASSFLATITGRIWRKLLRAFSPKPARR